MVRRTILYLLAGLSVVLAPISSSAQDFGTPDSVQRSRPNLRLPRAVRPGLPPREPVPTFRPPSAYPGNFSGLSSLVRAAGIIFSGTVIRVEARTGNEQTVATVAITFQVENAVRGITAGRELTIHEWTGVWSSGQRYRVGEHVFVFLYPRSKLGLTSSVAGPIGRFAVDTRGTLVLSPQHISFLRRHPVLGGKSRVSVSDFALAVRQAHEEE
ncbi:MAG TPA: hypothetical protein VF123_13620 [Candidatus Sulfotelmatobacter sp.]